MTRLSFDSTAALLAGQRGPIHFRYRLRESDVSGVAGRRAVDITGGEVSMSNFRDHTWELSFARGEMANEILTTLGDYVLLEVHVREAFEWDERFFDAQTEWTVFPFGLYRIEQPSAAHDMAASSYSIVAKSPEIIVLDDYATNGFLASTTEYSLRKSADVLMAAGVPAERIDFPWASDKKFNTPMWFDPHQDFSRTSRLRIINAMLNAGGFYGLYTDAEGYFRTKEIEDTSTRDASARWTSEGPFRMVVGAISEEFDLDNFANKVVVYSGDPTKGPMIDAVAVNDDPDSPGSINPPPIGLGRTIMRDPIALQNVVSVTEAKRVAQAQLKRASAVNHRVTLSVLPDPRRGPREDVELDVRRQVYPDPDAYGPMEGEPGKTVLSGLYTVVGFTWSLANPPQPMSVEVHRREVLRVT